MSGIIKRHAQKLNRYVRAWIEHQRFETWLLLETKLRETNEYINTKLQGIAYNGLGKPFHEHKHMRINKASLRDRTRQTTRDRTVMSPHRQQNQGVTRINYESKAFVKRVDIEKLAEKKHSSMERRVTPRSAKAPRAQAKCGLYDRQMPRVTHASTATKLEPEPSYIEKLRTLHPPSNDPDERMKLKNSLLGSVLGTERMQAGVGEASGHSGVTGDSVLSQHYQNTHRAEIFNAFDTWSSMRRQQEIEHQRLLAMKEAEQQEKFDLLRAHGLVYDERVQKLVSFGPALREAVDGLEQSLNSCDFELFMQFAPTLTSSVLEPAHAIIKEMAKAIPLELSGAQKLAEAWPLERIDALLKFLQKHLHEFPDFLQEKVAYMMKGLEIICKPIITAQPFSIPLNEKPILPSKMNSSPVNFETFMAAMMQQPVQLSSTPVVFEQQVSSDFRLQSAALAPVQIAQEQPQLPTSGEDNAGKNFSSFAALTAATKAASAGQQSLSVFDPASSSLTGVSSSGNTSSTNNMNNEMKDTVNNYIDRHVLDFQENVEKLITNKSLSSYKRQEIIEVLEWLESNTMGATRILGDTDSGMMRVAIDTLIHKIANMKDGKSKNHQKTREMDVLAHKVRKLWSV